MRIFFIIVIMAVFTAFPALVSNGKSKVILPMHLNHTIEEIHPEVKEILCLINSSERKEFVNILKVFGNERNMDWRIPLLLLYQESHLRCNNQSGSYVGIAMFGPDAFRALKTTRTAVLSMNAVEQLHLAIKMWKMSEKNGKKISTFLDLLIINFVPAWFGHNGAPYPYNESIYNANSAFVNAAGEITKESLLNFYRRKVQSEAALLYFHKLI